MSEDLRQTVALLQQELADTNREVLLLTLELEKRVADLEQANGALSQQITDRIRAEAKLQTQLSRLDLLHRITRAIGERQDLRSIFQVVIRNLEDDLPVHFACVCLHEPDLPSLTVTCVGSRSAEVAAQIEIVEPAAIPIDENGLRRCLTGRLVYEPDTRLVHAPFGRRLAGGGLFALVLAPLLAENKVFGILVAARREAGGFTSGDCEFLRQLSEHVALAARQAQLYGSLQKAYDDLRRTQDAVMQQERLSALGQMASGIAHDINNSISPVALYTESLLERETNLSDRARNYLKTIQRAIEDVAQTVARMREFYRPREPQLSLTPVRLNSLVEQVLELTRARWHDMPGERGIVIHVASELTSGLPEVMGIESEIRDAFTNLILNAVDAMPEGGKLIVRTVAGEGQAKVEIADTGIGMDEETRHRCLEPFFTTKGERGTGLGLAMVYGMTRRHRAEIEIDSEPGKGSTVRLIFPKAPQAAPPQVRLPSPKVVKKQLSLLVVDDDPLILRSLRDILQAEGHLVATADGGQAGIDMFREARQNGNFYSAVITDLGMPYVDGRKVAAAIKTIHGATPVILLTGWGQRLRDEQGAPQHVDLLLNKPPSLRELRAALAGLAGDESE